MFESGQTILHYRLVDRLGEGGMGSVWLAEDTTLDRLAAIKVLPSRLAEDEQFIARFDREAKLLASLNHPNLATVFGVHELDGNRVLAMEHVPGEDLSERLKRGPLAVEEAIPIATQIASAIEAAHQRSVIHRDLKPANIRITPEGLVKVLDFGLAKALESEVSRADEAKRDADLSLTATGVVLGTVPYMSPEQARGEAVDSRTDVWAFGCLLFECLVGTHPFPAKTIAEQISAILTQEPDWDRLPRGVPDPVVGILQRSLQKPLDRRLQDIGDARVELEAARTTGPATSPVPARRKPAAVLALALIVGALGLAAWFALGPGGEAPRGSVLDGYTTTHFTTFPGEELDASISPDGEYVAFLADRQVTDHGAAELGGIFHVFRGEISTQFFEQVSKESGEAGLEAPMLKVRRLGFLGDGKGLWVGGIRRHLRRVSFLDGKEMDWLDQGMIHVDWSRDGKKIVFSHMLHGDPMYVADASALPIATPEVPILKAKEGYHQHFPTWSWDGKWIYFVHGIVALGEMDLCRVRPNGRDPEQLSEGLRYVAYPVSMDDRTVLFVAETEDGAGPWLWEFDVETRTPKRVPTGSDRYLSLSASRDRSRIAATVSNPTARLFAIPLRKSAGEGKATEEDVKPHPLPAVRALCPRFGGGYLYFLSSRGSGDGLWRHRSGDAQPEEVWSPRRGPIQDPVAISPNGSIALVARKPRPELYILDAAGKNSTRVMADVDVLGAPAWSHDGNAVLIGGRQGRRLGLFRARRAEGWKTERLLEAPATNPVCSPDGKLILFAGPHIATGQRLFACTPDGKQKKDFPEIWIRPFGERVRFLPDGSGVVYTKGVDPTQEFFYLDLKTGVSTEITALADSSVTRTFDLTPDGSSIVFDRQRGNTDVVLIQHRDR